MIIHVYGNTILLVIIMLIPFWICLDCNKRFRPVANSMRSFDCPDCGSPKTVRASLQRLRVNC